MRGKTSHPSYLQFTPDRGNPGNSPVVHARKTHKSTMSTNCPPGHALACMESNRAKALLLQQKHKHLNPFSLRVMSIMHTDASKDLSQLALEEEEEMSGLSVSLCAGWFVCEQQENALKNATRCTFVSSGSPNRGRSATLQMHFE